MSDFKTRIRALVEAEQERAMKVKSAQAAGGKQAEQLRTIGVELMARVFDVANEAANALLAQGISASAEKLNEMTVELAVPNGRITATAQVQAQRVWVSAESDVRGRGAKIDTPPLGDNERLTNEAVQQYFAEWIGERLDLTV